MWYSYLQYDVLASLLAHERIPLTLRLVLCALEAEECLSAFTQQKRQLPETSSCSCLLSLYTACCFRNYYFRVTFAPSASSFVFSSSASALDAPSLTTFGAPSTTSLASFRPRPVASRTTLITLTLFGPTSVSSTSNSVFSSASSAAPAPAAATTTPAAADTPNSSSHAFTSSLSSSTDNSLIASINSAVVYFAISFSS